MEELYEKLFQGFIDYWRTYDKFIKDYEQFKRRENLILRIMTTLFIVLFFIIIFMYISSNDASNIKYRQECFYLYV